MCATRRIVIAEVESAAAPAEELCSSLWTEGEGSLATNDDCQERGGRTIISSAIEGVVVDIIV